MAFRVLLSCIILSWATLCLAEDVKVTVEGVTSIAKTDDTFVCATLDWWPSGKCDYNQCPWGQAGLLNLVWRTCTHKHTHMYICIYIST